MKAALEEVLSAAVACAATIGVFVALRLLHLRFRSAWTLPIVTSVVSILCALFLLHVDVALYARASRPLSFWLGPATVALAVPLHRERALFFRHLRAVLVAVVAGAAVSIASVAALGVAARLSSIVVRSLVPKSVTTPIAMPIAERIGGIPAIAAAAVVVTGVLGMAFGPKLLDLARVRSPIARGLALGASAHGIGTARAFDETALTGAMSGVAMIVSGLSTALLAPLVARLL